MLDSPAARITGVPHRVHPEVAALMFLNCSLVAEKLIVSVKCCSRREADLMMANLCIILLTDRMAYET